MLKRTETYTPFIYLLSFSIGNIQINLDFYVRVRAYEKRVNGKQPLVALAPGLRPERLFAPLATE